MLWVIFFYSFCTAYALIAYNNARFEPFNPQFLRDNIPNVYSQTQCACLCFNNSLCFTATYSGINQQCILYMARLDQGILRIMTTNLMTSVLNFEDRTLNRSLLTNSSETVYGIWNTTAGQNSQAASAGFSVGNYAPGQGPVQAFDQNSTSKYVNFGICNSTVGGSQANCGYNTGLYLLLQRGPSLLIGFRFQTPNSYPERDPITITLEGSNQPLSALVFGSSWTLIYNGPSGLDTDPGRFSYGQIQWISNNTIWYASYRLLIISKRTVGNFVQYGEFELFGY